MIREEHSCSGEDRENRNGALDKGFHNFPVVGKEGAPVRPRRRSDARPRILPKVSSGLSNVGPAVAPLDRRLIGGDRTSWAHQGVRRGALQCGSAAQHLGAVVSPERRGQGKTSPPAPKRQTKRTRRRTGTISRVGRRLNKALSQDAATSRGRGSDGLADRRTGACADSARGYGAPPVPAPRSRGRDAARRHGLAKRDRLSEGGPIGRL